MSNIAKLYNDPKFGLVGIEVFRKKLAEKGINASREDIVKALSNQDSYTLNKPIKKKFQNRRVIAYDVFEQLQMDLVHMDTPNGAPASENKGYKYILTAIDVLSKYAWAIPLKDKTGASTLAALSKIIKVADPEKIQVDKGKEFYNKQVEALLKKHNILLFSTQSDKKASVVERFNRTLKQRMTKLFDAQNNTKYIDHLDDLVNNYNNTIHSSIKMTPADAIKPENHELLLQNFYSKQSTKKMPKFKVGDYVRIVKWKSTFAKELVGNWTIEIFKIRQVNKTQPVTYLLKDLMDEDIQGGFYENELQKVSPDLVNRGRVAKVLKKRTQNGVKQVLVQWEGYPDKFNSWIAEENLNE